MSKHTPGPWILQNKYNFIHCGENGQGVRIAHVDPGQELDCDCVLANAKLIAEAPIMLQLLKDICEECPDDPQPITLNCDYCKVRELLTELGENNVS